MNARAKILSLGMVLVPLAAFAGPPAVAPSPIAPVTPVSPAPVSPAVPAPDAGVRRVDGSEASYELLIRAAQRLAAANADSATRVRQLQVRLDSLQSERIALLTRIRALEARLATLAGPDRDLARAQIARLHLEVGRLDREIATIRVQIADETEQQRVREQERQRVLRAAEAKRLRGGKAAPLPVPSPVTR